MNEKAQEDEFDDDDDDQIDADDVESGDDVDVEHLFRDMDKRKKTGVKTGDPAWRKLERYREDRHTAELVSDFDDYDIGDSSDDTEANNHGHSLHHHRRAS